MKLLMMPSLIGPLAVTTSERLESTLRAIVQHPHYAGDSVGEFIDTLLRMPGVSRDTPLASIEYGIAMHGTGRLCVEFNEHGFAEVKEKVSHAG